MPGPTRADHLARLARESFDLLVVGGGINGAGIARDAALRGMSVALVERDDWASGTSSRSSRLIHGGVRYLEHGYLHLVWEASRERRTLLTIAPHLVRPLPFTWPVYRGARIPRWKLAAGLWLYDLLAAFGNVANHERLDAAGVLAREPNVRRDGLTGGARYYDAATHDARLTWANVQDAAMHGAVVLNHAMVVSLTRASDAGNGQPRRAAGPDAVPDATGVAPSAGGASIAPARGAAAGRVTGAVVRDIAGGQEVRVRARVVVNAAGPWHDDVERLDNAGLAPGVRGTKGVHVEVERGRIGNRDAITVISGVDGRVMFVLPAGPHAIIGTTDTPTDEPPDQVRASEADIRYLLDSANLAFPEARLVRDDVISAWAGIRPLIASGNSGNPSSASREHQITTSASRMVSVTGGKLTTYRSMSAEVVQAAARASGQRIPRSRTADRPLPGGDLRSVRELERAVADQVGAEDIAQHLVESYGSEWESVWRLTEARPAWRERVASGLPTPWASVAWAVREEMALTLADVLVRRTKLAYQLRDHGVAVAPTVAELMGAELGWTRAGVELAVAEYGLEVERLFGVS
ncbi:MAG: glycerol-3-phosphate dehydrogenase/oxidase [Gemmatimonadetes bacterium]|nr:glycerol-3-phosphate dehydrogenase/oxidase [Gemmatimonadota bacterium]